MADDQARHPKTRPVAAQPECMSEAESHGRPDILVLLAHPRGTSTLCGALAEAYAKGAHEAGADVRLVDLSALDFQPFLRQQSPKRQPLEPDLVAMKAAIDRADHLVFVYPTWWGTFPALLKAFLDRILVEGWAFEETTGGTGYNGLLGGRSAELITTMDTPGVVYGLAMRAPGRNALSRSTLGFCGIDVVRHTRFGIVKDSDLGERTRWIEESRMLGYRVRNGVHRPLQRLWRSISPWLAAMRLQFYPMTFTAYWVGALLATRNREMDLVAFAIGYVILFALEVATVFFNDIYDFESDEQNRFHSLFSGGSRVLVEGRLKPDDLRRGATMALATAFAFTLLLISVSDAPLFGSLLILAALSLLAIFYTVPPIKLSHRGLGEIDVALTHSFGVLFCGFIFQNARISDPAPWLISVLLFLAVLPAITLSGVPDAEADRMAAKRTLVVRFSIRWAMLFAALITAAAALLSALFNWFDVASDVLSGLGILAVIHGSWLTWLIVRRRSEVAEACRIDRLMAASLAFITWFSIVPLVNLLSAR